ncbi:MAG: hypothetical protein F7C35_00790 [Desulfurococcales archaeon]|nr:hypothetical protein [Desulfurococcales archaeon]
MVFGFLRGRGADWIDKVSIEELEKERIRVETRANMVLRQIQRLEAEKERLYEYGKNVPEGEKVMIAEKIKNIEDEIASKQREYGDLLRQRQALINLIRLKRWEAQLKKKGIWEKIKKVDPEKLIDKLADIKFEKESFDQNVEAIVAAIGPEIGGYPVDARTKKIMEKMKGEEEK